MQLSQNQLSDQDTLSVSFKVKNTGNVAGKEIVQLYVRDVESTAFRPDKELKGFAKVDLAPGEESEVIIELGQRAFAYYNTDLGDWHIESGTFEILVGASSRDIRLTETVEITSTQPAAPEIDREKLAAYYDIPKGQPVNKAAFEALLGRPVPPNLGQQKGSYTFNTPVGDMSDSFIGRQLANMMNKQISKMIAGMEDTPTALLMEAMVKELPLRGMLMTGDGSLNREMLDALLVMINGEFFKGFGALIKAARNK